MANFKQSYMVTNLSEGGMLVETVPDAGFKPAATFSPIYERTDPSSPVLFKKVLHHNGE